MIMWHPDTLATSWKAVQAVIDKELEIIRSNNEG